MFVHSFLKLSKIDISENLTVSCARLLVVSGEANRSGFSRSTATFRGRKIEAPQVPRIGCVPLSLVVVRLLSGLMNVVMPLPQAFEDRDFINFEFFAVNNYRRLAAVSVALGSAAWMREDGDRCDPEDHGEDNATAVVELFGRLRQIIVIQYRSGQNFDQRKENKQCAD